MESDEDVEVIEEMSDEDEESKSKDEKPLTDSQGFVVIGSQDQSSEQFTVINSSQKDSKQQWQIIGDSHSSIAGGAEDPSGSISSYDNLKKVMTGKRKGMSRAEAFAALDIDKAEMMDTGEIRLPNGKIIGHRQYKHIYRQKLRTPDEREAVIINKLAIEYRRMKQELEGFKYNGALMLAGHGYKVDYALDLAQKKYENRKRKDLMKLGIKNNKVL